MSSMVIFPLAMYELKRKEQVARHNGFLDGMQHTVKVLSKKFGKPPKDADIEVLYSLKTTDIVVFKIDGVNTVGIAP
ncbi:hypothetical protein O5O45_09840 [Hahella aquimaris]|uniref:hypothetical protein n=1 Tax=Hahella sp. HNIBRBA332 TaxID=3015983 RepID=UPI00273AF1D0|nr:hypothetical protein [Hahella sp. HNIBRBA332]WLQ16215.1 hypothetical protein O5O45_09840 [Hahella sp. HNIBRBA332]